MKRASIPELHVGAFDPTLPSKRSRFHGVASNISSHIPEMPKATDGWPSTGSRLRLAKHVFTSY